MGAGQPLLDRVMLPGQRNLARSQGVVPYMNSINEVHVHEPGLVVVDVAAADSATALTFQDALAARWATAAAEHVTHLPGQPGVRLRCFLDLRQPVASHTVRDFAEVALSAEEPGSLPVRP